MTDRAAPTAEPDSVAAIVRRLAADDSDASARDIADGLWLALYRREAVLGPKPVESPADSDDTEEPKPESELDVPDSVTPHITPPQRERPAATGELYLRQNDAGPAPPSQDLPTGRAATAPGAPALPDGAELLGALRPLMRRVPSSTRRVLDTDRTVYRIAEEGIREIVLRPAAVRWLDAAIVVDTSGAMVLWRDTVQELAQRLDRMGAFRSVRVWGWASADRAPEPTLCTHPFEITASNSPRLPRELLGPDGRQLIFVISDCVSAGWRDGRAVRLIRGWKDRAHVALVQPLPERMWPRTGLSGASMVSIRPGRPGPANGQLVWTPVRLSSVSTRAIKARDAEQPGLVLPVVTLEKNPLAAWASLVAGRRRTTPGGITTAHGFYWPAPPDGDGPANDPNAPPVLAPVPVDAATIVRRFLSTASTQARRLAGLLAAAPAVNLPVLRLVRETMVPDAGQVHEAEVLLGGLLCPGASTGDGPSNQMLLDFRPGVREQLQDLLAPSETLSVLSRVSKYVSDHWGELRNFPAVLRDPTSHGGTIRAAGGPFAKVAAQILTRLGGPYAGLVARPADSRTVRILQLCFPPPRRPWSEELLNGIVQVVRDMSSSGLAPDLIVVGVDFESHSYDQYQAAAESLKAIVLPAAGITDPTRLVFANEYSLHDDGSGRVPLRFTVRNVEVAVGRFGQSGRSGQSPDDLNQLFFESETADLVIASHPLGINDLPEPEREAVISTLIRRDCRLMLGAGGKAGTQVVWSGGWKLLAISPGLENGSDKTHPLIQLVEADTELRQFRIHRRFWRETQWTDQVPPGAWSIPSCWFDRATLPTAAEFSALPFWAVIALAGQCGLYAITAGSMYIGAEDTGLIVGIEAASNIALDAAETAADPEVVVGKLAGINWEPLFAARTADRSEATRAAVAIVRFAWVAFGASDEARSSDRFVWPTTAGTSISRPEMNEAAAAVLQALAEISRDEPSDNVYHEFRRFYDRIAAEAVEQQWNDQTPVRVDRPADPSDATAGPTRWVLVAGTARFELEPEELDAAAKIGAALAQAGYGLITCGRRGVDHVTAQSFAETLEVSRPTAKYLTNVLGGNRVSDFRRGREMRVPSAEDEAFSSVGMADAVVLIGGSGWTETIGLAAWQSNKPVLPLAATGGMAYDFVRRLWGDPVPLTLDDLDRLAAEVPDAVAASGEILNRLFSLATAPRPTPVPIPSAPVQDDPSDRTRPPTARDFAGLSKWECTAIVSRCLRRVLPLLAEAGPEFSATAHSLDQLVNLADQRAETGTPLDQSLSEVTSQMADLSGFTTMFLTEQVQARRIGAGIVAVGSALMRLLTGDESDAARLAAEAAAAAVDLLETQPLGADSTDASADSDAENDIDDDPGPTAAEGEPA